MTNRTKIVIIALALLIITPLVIWGVGSVVNNSSNSTVIKDKDTGETLDTSDEGIQTGGGIAKKSDIVLFGSENLAKVARDKNKATGRYLIATQDALWAYGEKRLEKEFPTLTIRPQNLIVTSEKISGEIRIGQTDTIVPFRVDIAKGNDAAIVTINENGSEHGGKFVFVGGIENEDELLYTITQKNDTSTDLVIQSYGGYWEAAMKYLYSIGYNIPDFSIELLNFEGVF